MGARCILKNNDIMENLKLTSIRVPKEYLVTADKLGKELGYYQRSHILRVAIWLGLKFIRPGVFHKLLEMMWKEEIGRERFSLEDVLRTAGTIDRVNHGERV